MDKNSTTKPEPDTIIPVKTNTRNSLAPSNSSASSSSSRLNYLRASTGSCHDLCKYGKEQSFEEKSRTPLQRRLISRPADNQILTRSAISPDRRKKSPILRPKSASGSESRNFDGSPDIRKEKASKPDGRKSLPTGSLADNKKKDTSVLYPKSISSAARSVLSDPRKLSQDDASVIKQLSKKVLPQSLSKNPNLPVKSISGPPRLSSSPNRSLTPKRANDKEKEGKGRGNSVVQKNISGGKIPGAKSVLPRMSVEKQKPNKVGAISKADVMDETLCAPNEETVRIDSPVSGLAVADRNEISSDICVSPEKEGKGRGNSVVQKNVSGGKIPGAKSVLPRMSVEKQKPNKVDAISKADVMDETLCAPNEETVQIDSPVSGLAVADRNEISSDICVSPETSASVATSILLSNSPVLSFQEEDKMEQETGFELSSKLNCPILASQEELEMVSDSEDYYSDSDYEENPTSQLEEEISEGDREAWAARMRASLPEDVESKPTKLQFRRGKIVDLQSEGDNGPRRLKFRRGRVLEQSRDVNGSTRKKRASRSEIEDGGGDSVDPSEKVVLRHNDLEERKDGQASLLNNVIEETASKLVEARKSKVKALVGAFETVISLHDTKPSAGS